MLSLALERAHKDLGRMKSHLSLPQLSHKVLFSQIALLCAPLKRDVAAVDVVLESHDFVLLVKDLLDVFLLAQTLSHKGFLV